MGKESTCNAGMDMTLTESFPGEENGNSLKSSWLENRMDRGTWWTMAQEVTGV